MELSAGFVLDTAGVRTVKRAEARAPTADSVTLRFVRSSLCRIFLRISRGIIGLFFLVPNERGYPCGRFVIVYFAHAHASQQ
jgi:hypothetical protein